MAVDPGRAARASLRLKAWWDQEGGWEVLGYDVPIPYEEIVRVVLEAADAPVVRPGHKAC